MSDPGPVPIPEPHTTTRARLLEHDVLDSLAEFLDLAEQAIDLAHPELNTDSSHMPRVELTPQFVPRPGARDHGQSPPLDPARLSAVPNPRILNRPPSVAHPDGGQPPSAPVPLALTRKPPDLRGFGPPATVAGRCRPGAIGTPDLSARTSPGGRRAPRPARWPRSRRGA